MKPNPPSATANKGNVLIVDDEMPNIQLLQAALEQMDYQTIVAQDGNTALELAQQQRPDVILLDVMMPGMSGFDVCRRLKEISDTAHIPVILVTGLSERQDRLDGIKAGADEFLTKPVDFQELRLRVLNAVKIKKLFDQNLLYQQSMEEELNIARDMQQNLLPKSPPSISEVEVDGRCLSATQIGGDLFQYFPLSAEQLAVSLVDVTGHGMMAALPMMVFNGILESKMEAPKELGALFGQLNRSLCRVLDRRTLACFLMGEFDLSAGVLRLANSGCPYPYLYRAATGDLEELQLDAYPLGAMPDSQYPTLERRLDKGDRVVFFSDGIPEVQRKGADEESFGYERLFQLVLDGCRQDMGTEALVDKVLQEVKAFSGQEAQEDDQTIVAVQVL